MVAQLSSERDFRGPGCGDACRVVRALLPGVFGRSELLLHDPAAHEAYGRRQSWLASDASCVVSGPLSIDLRRSTVSVDGTPIALTATELKIMLFLADPPDTLRTHEQIADAVWPPEYWGGDLEATRHALNVNVARIRRKLGRAAALVSTAVKLGYRLELLSPGADPPPRPGPIWHGPRWHPLLAACRHCGSVAYPHYAGGYCEQSDCRNHYERDKQRRRRGAP